MILYWISMVKNAKSPHDDGAMAEWLGRALQKLVRRFKSGSCLHHFPQIYSGQNHLKPQSRQDAKNFVINNNGLTNYFHIYL